MTRHSRPLSIVEKMNLPTFIFYSWLKYQGNDELQVILGLYGRSKYLAYKLRELARYEARDVLERLDLADIDYDAIARKIQLRLEYGNAVSREVGDDIDDELETIGDDDDTN